MRFIGKEFFLMWLVYNMNYVKLYSIICLRCIVMNVNLRYVFVVIYRGKC